jgi:prepilin-type N-terminal cleavage/methylation domain-containing protein
MKRDSGFSLMEILLAMTILAILATIGATGYRHHRKAAAETVLIANLGIMRRAIEQYKADTGKYPPSLDALWNESSRRYLRELPLDPITRTNNMWVPYFDPGDPDDPDAAPGVSDVRSGAEGITSDGKPYIDL